MKLLKMKMILLLVSQIVFSCFDKSLGESNDCIPLSDNPDSAKYLKILFIGNSHTYTHDIPQTISFMAASKSDSASIRQEALGGYTLKQHSRRLETLDAIKSEKWDFVILQEQGGIQALPKSIADTVIYRYAQILTNHIRANRQDTKIILYMTHGYKNGVLTWNDVLWCKEDPLVCTYSGMQRRVKDNSITLSGILHADVAPAGVLWKIIMDEHRKLDLFDSDGTHATPIGSYLSACVLYSVIFKKRPILIYKPETIVEETAQIIQNTVARTLFDCDPNWKDYK